jgi:hypothetical protein
MPLKRMQTREALSGWFQGYDQLQAKLTRFRRSDALNIMRSALTHGLRPIRNRARSLMQGRYRFVKPDIRQRTSKKKAGGYIEGRVGGGVAQSKASMAAKAAAVQFSKRKPTRPGVGMSARNIHWAAVGTAHRYKKNGQSTGVMPVQSQVAHYMRRAYSSARGQAKRAMHRRASLLIKKYASRMRRK